MILSALIFMDCFHLHDHCVHLDPFTGWYDAKPSAASSLLERYRGAKEEEAAQQPQQDADASVSQNERVKTAFG